MYTSKPAPKKPLIPKRAAAAFYDLSLFKSAVSVWDMNPGLPSDSGFISGFTPGMWPLNGNKLLKLQPVLRAVRAQGKSGICCVGGGRSNMLAAVAAYGRQAGFPVVVLTRAPRPAAGNPQQADFQALLRGFGARVVRLDEAAFRCRDTPAFARRFRAAYPRLLFVSEGGANFPAFAAMRAFFAGNVPPGFDIYTVPVGTGATYAALLAARPEARVIGFSAFKNTVQQAALVKTLTARVPEIIHHPPSGRFGKTTPALSAFAADLRSGSCGVQPVFDPVYNLKTLHAVFALLRSGTLNNARSAPRICHCNTGGYVPDPVPETPV